MTHKHITLTVGFDIDQISDALSYHFDSPDHAHPNPITGLYANEIYLREGACFHLRVKGGGPTAELASFQVLDCCLVTRPQLAVTGPGLPNRYATPSPFLQAIGASYQFSLDFNTTQHDFPEQKYRVITQHWKHTLDVTHSHGRWDLALILTVKIQRGPMALPEIRVFSFDPEGQVGPGGGSD